MYALYSTIYIYIYIHWEVYFFEKCDEAFTFPLVSEIWKRKMKTKKTYSYRHTP